MKDLTELRKIAEEATPGEWVHWNPSVGESHIAIANKVAWRSLKSSTKFADDEKIPHWADATHIATFDPPTVLALITRLEQAEAAVARVEKLLADSEEVEAMMPDQYDRIWISSVRRALGGEQG